ncbi:uncharacterized protein LOC144058978 [Vanacampus margaritifer]
MAPNFAKNGKIESFTWTNDEVELLLRVMRDFKTAKLRENVDWESWPLKYADVTDAFLAKYPRHSTGQDFPHHANAITKAQITAKVKNIRVKYKQAVQTGRRHGHGSAVLLFFELCEDIWGRSPGTCLIDAGVDTGDIQEEDVKEDTKLEDFKEDVINKDVINKDIKEEDVKEEDIIKVEDIKEEPSSSSSPTLELSTDSPQSVESNDIPPPAVVNQRSALPRANPSNRHNSKLKRKSELDPEVLEDLQLKKRMLKLIEDSSRQSADAMQQITANISHLNNAIQEGFSLLRQLLAQSHSNSNRSSMDMSPRDTKPCMCAHNTSTNHQPLQHNCVNGTDHCYCCRRC